MTTFVDLDTARVLGVVDGRDSAGVRAWLTARPQAWRDEVQVVAIDPSAAFRKAIRTELPRVAVSVDHFHLVQLANDMVTVVRLMYSSSLAGAQTEKMRLGVFVLAANCPRPTGSGPPSAPGGPAIEVLVVTGITKAKTEAANTSIKQLKRSGRGFRNEHHSARPPQTPHRPPSTPARRSRFAGARGLAAAPSTRRGADTGTQISGLPCTASSS
jgi:hypothetical protein